MRFVLVNAYVKHFSICVLINLFYFFFLYLLAWLNNQFEGYPQYESQGYSCDLCGKSYGSNKSNVSRHKRYYCPFTVKAPLIYCYVCPFSCRRPDNFRTHMRRMHQIYEWLWSIWTNTLLAKYIVNQRS